MVFSSILAPIALTTNPHSISAANMALRGLRCNSSCVPSGIQRNLDLDLSSRPASSIVGSRNLGAGACSACPVLPQRPQIGAGGGWGARVALD